MPELQTFAGTHFAHQVGMFTETFNFLAQYFVSNAKVSTKMKNEDILGAELLLEQNCKMLDSLTQQTARL